MKKVKVFFSIAIIAIFTLMSCDDEKSNDIQTHSQSEAAKSSMAKLKTHLNLDGSVNSHDNKATGILFDYGFSFKFPVTLMHNTNKSTSYTDFDSLVQDLLVMDESEYIDGVIFPFEVRVFDKSQKTVVTKTIENEQEFKTLNKLTWKNDNDKFYWCNYDPVCVEYTNCWGEVKIWKFHSAHIAYHYGYTDADFVDCNPTPCYTLNYPVRIINSCGYQITIYSDRQWKNMLYWNHGVYQFVFPFDVTLTINGDVITINNLAEFENLEVNCQENCGCTDVYDPVCVLINGDLTEFENSCRAECAGYTDFTACSQPKN